MKSSYLLVGVLLIALCSAAVSAETYYFEGATSNGEYTGTLVVGNDGSAALSLAAVSGGTMTEEPSGPLEATFPSPTFGAMVAQNLTFDVANGQGFAGCSVIGASGDRASTGALVSGTQANVNQEAGSFEWAYNAPGFTVPVSAVYAVQNLSSGLSGAFARPESAGFIDAATWAESSKGDSALVQANSTGSLNVLQGAVAGTASATFNNGYVGVNGAVAGQNGGMGYLNPWNGPYQVDGASTIDVSGTATDAQGNTASTSTQVEDGYLSSFFQVVGAGTLDAAYDFFGVGPSAGVLGANITGAVAVQDVSGGGSVSSESGASLATGHSANAGLMITDGEFEFTQGALTGTAGAGFNTSNAGVGYALAGQGGSFTTSGTGQLTGTAGNANGNSVSTETTLTDGSADLFVQAVGVGNGELNLDLEDLFGIPGSGPYLAGSGVFGGQYLDGDGSSVSAETSAMSDAGNTADIALTTNGTFNYGQGALAGSASASYNTSSAGIGYAVAGQGGSFATTGTGQLTGTAGDANGNSVSTETTLTDGSADLFVQVVGSGNADVDLDLEDLFGIPGSGPQAGISGAFGGQYLDGDGSSVSAETSATSDTGNTANVTLTTDGTFEYGQGALAGSASASYNSSHAGIGYAVAGQGGSFTTGTGGNGQLTGTADDANGNSVFTVSGVQNGSLSFFQMVGAGNVDAHLDADLLGMTDDDPEGSVTGAFGLQYMNGESTDGVLGSFTGGANGDNVAGVAAGASGNVTGWVAQGVVASDVNVDTGLEDVDDIQVNGALAGQVGQFQNKTATGSTDAVAIGFGANSMGDTAGVVSYAENGTLGFAQLALGGGVDAGKDGNVTAALALQVSEVSGTGGYVGAGCMNGAGNQSRVNVTFNNLDSQVGVIRSASGAGSGSVNTPHFGIDSISGTGAGLWEFSHTGTLTGYNVSAYAETSGPVSKDDNSDVLATRYAYAYTGPGDLDAEVGS
jgi:hypothetical protein